MTVIKCKDFKVVKERSTIVDLFMFCWSECTRHLHPGTTLFFSEPLC